METCKAHRKLKKILSETFFNCTTGNAQKLVIQLNADTLYTTNKCGKISIGMHLDKKLTWKHHIQKKGANKNKEKIYVLAYGKAIPVKPWKQAINIQNTYQTDLDLWHWSMGNIDSYVKNIESAQSIILRTIVNAPWYIRNKELRKDLGISIVKEKIEQYCGKYKIKVDN